jgi:NADH:ubiquinone oxidoreductase subunit F (NADH-binding)
MGPGAVVLVNGAEGEPLSHKDRSLLLLRPHLVLDGAELAAEAVGADEIVLYVGERHEAGAQSIARAVAERSRADRGRRYAGSRAGIRLLRGPDGYVSGEESAAVHFVNESDARPTVTPPRPYERGVAGLPTLVQNVESLAYVALIARLGAGWYREAGRGETRGTTLVTVTRPDGRPLVHEMELGTTIGEIARLGESPITQDETQAVLLGGYFGRWLDARDTWDTPLDPAVLRTDGLSIGAGVVSFLSARTCPVVATARIADYMARQSAAQCGPCVFGLRSIAEAMIRLARAEARRDDLANLERWAGQVRNRGACRHPDGAVGMLTSGLETFGHEIARHQRQRSCSFVEVRPNQSLAGGALSRVA